MRPALRPIAALALAAALVPPPSRAAETRPARPATAIPRTGPTQNPELLTAQQRELLAAATELSHQCSEVIERWIAGGEISREALFSALYYPKPKPRTDPPKFSTDWDRLADRDLLAVEEAVLARSPAVVYAVLVDRNGYVPTHNRRFAEPPTGNAGVDLLNSRSKRLFVDQAGLAAARNESGFLLQRYARDTGEVLWDLSVPVTVRGKHFGAVRIGFRPLENP